MLQRTNIYKIEEVPSQTVQFYRQELNELIEQTEMGDGVFVPQNEDETMDYLEGKEIKELTDEIAIKARDYLKNTCEKEIDVIDIKNKYQSTYKGITVLIALRRILPEWWHYFAYTGLCEVYFIESWINESRQGGIFAFKRKNKDFIQIQAISKYISAALVGVLYPECNMYRLNEGLDAAILSLARTSQSNYIYVKPIGEQMMILEKYYGYKMLINGHPMVKSTNLPYYEDYETRFYACDIVEQAYGYWYYKQVPP